MIIMDVADRQQNAVAHTKLARLRDKIAVLREQVRQSRVMRVAIDNLPGRQLSLTDPDTRAMATSGRGTGIVGHNGQTAVDIRHHLIVAPRGTTKRYDRGQLSGMTRQARETMDRAKLTAIADRGYDKGEHTPAVQAERRNADGAQDP